MDLANRHVAPNGALALQRRLSTELAVFKIDNLIEDDHIVMLRKSKLLVPKPLELSEPVPMRPPGYFQDCYDKDAAKETNKLAARSIRKIVK